MHGARLYIPGRMTESGLSRPSTGSTAALPTSTARLGSTFAIPLAPSTNASGDAKDVGV